MLNIIGFLLIVFVFGIIRYQWYKAESRSTEMFEMIDSIKNILSEKRSYESLEARLQHARDYTDFTIETFEKKVLDDK